MIIPSQRLEIRTFSTNTWQGLLEICRDFESGPFRFYDTPLPTEEDGARALTGECACCGLVFGVYVPNDPAMIGYICFHKADHTLDLGYCFHSRIHRRGYAYEACSALLPEIERRYSEQKFTAYTALENRPSCKLLERLGFHPTGQKKISLCADSNGSPIFFTELKYSK